MAAVFGADAGAGLTSASTCSALASAMMPRGVGLNSEKPPLVVEANASMVGAAAGSTSSHSAGNRKFTVSAGETSAMTKAGAGGKLGRAAKPAAKPPIPAAPMIERQARVRLPERYLRPRIPPRTNYVPASVHTA